MDGKLERLAYEDMDLLESIIWSKSKSGIGPYKDGGL